MRYSAIFLKCFPGVKLKMEVSNVREIKSVSTLFWFAPNKQKIRVQSQKETQIPLGLRQEGRPV